MRGSRCYKRFLFVLVHKTHREELDASLWLLSKILCLLPELISKRWQVHSLSRVIAKLIHHGNGSKLRKDGVRWVFDLSCVLICELKPFFIDISCFGINALARTLRSSCTRCSTSLSPVWQSPIKTFRDPATLSTTPHKTSSIIQTWKVNSAPQYSMTRDRIRSNLPKSRRYFRRLRVNVRPLPIPKMAWKFCSNAWSSPVDV